MYGPDGPAALTWAAWPLRTPEGCFETTFEPSASFSPSVPPVPQVRLYRESFSIDDTLEQKKPQTACQDARTNAEVLKFSDCNNYICSVIAMKLKGFPTLYLDNQRIFFSKVKAFWEDFFCHVKTIIGSQCAHKVTLQNHRCMEDFKGI